MILQGSVRPDHNKSLEFELRPQSLNRQVKQRCSSRQECRLIGFNILLRI
jgi:hypothetical protein